ncbi:putative Ribosomal RNA-processing protein 8 [Paratrimastix pyriformis]|uniref:Ribosomal RNA-processing protein 8 n=1 Tax=Paratrimastix pyriformis TaxID=342808 RepID=A0ABQ8UG42_9EUKA|nr:putative Ribosomal RNA-processing protein 8 [Paratrimastix pyriformis]
METVSVQEESLDALEAPVPARPKRSKRSRKHRADPVKPSGQEKKSSQKKPRMEKDDEEPEQAQAQEQNTAEGSPPDEPADSEQAPTKPARRGPPQNRFENQLHERLEAGQFRWINEQLYTTTGTDATQLFKKEPHLFDIYHRGFAHQVSQWPSNPLDIFIKELSKRRGLVIADFGCGEGRLGRSVPHSTVHSFDLVARHPHITACDLTHVPLQDATCDVVVSCLALMGTNYPDFIREAWRVLKPGGLYRVAEVASRITNVDMFVQLFKSLGFELRTKDERNKMFTLFAFSKDASSPPARRRIGPAMAAEILKPCLYKKRESRSAILRDQSS